MYECMFDVSMLFLHFRHKRRSPTPSIYIIKAYMIYSIIMFIHIKIENKYRNFFYLFALIPMKIGNFQFNLTPLKFRVWTKKYIRKKRVAHL